MKLHLFQKILTLYILNFKMRNRDVISPLKFEHTTLVKEKESEIDKTPEA